MIVSLVILLIAFILIFIGYSNVNNFFTLAGGFLLLISGIIFLSTPLAVQDGYVINETSESITEVNVQYSQPPGLLNHAFNLVIILVGMMFMWDSYIKLREDRYERFENE